MKKLLKISFKATILLIILWFCGFIYFNNKITEFEKNSEKTDAIVVLTGGKNRINIAKRLFKDGFADKMFISGVSKKVSLKDIINRDDVVVVIDNIEIGQEAQNTVENAIEVDNWVTKNNISSIRLVTSNYHMPRSLKEIEAKNDNVRIIIHPVFSENVSKEWWKSWNSFVFIAAEYNKFIFSYIKNSF